MQLLLLLVEILQWRKPGNCPLEVTFTQIKPSKGKKRSQVRVNLNVRTQNRAIVRNAIDY